MGHAPSDVRGHGTARALTFWQSFAVIALGCVLVVVGELLGLALVTWLGIGLAVSSGLVPLSRRNGDGIARSVIAAIAASGIGGGLALGGAAITGPAGDESVQSISMEVPE